MVRRQGGERGGDGHADDALGAADPSTARHPAGRGPFRRPPRPALEALLAAGDALTRADAPSGDAFRSLIENAPDALFVHRHDVLLYLNPAACRALGYSGPAELIGGSASALIDPADREAVAARVERLEAGEPTDARDIGFRRRDGTAVTLEVHSLPVVFEGGPAVLAMARDVSEHRRAQAREIQADRVLSVGTLAAGVAHEINNPLTYVVTNVSWASRELRGMILADPGAPGSGRLQEVLEALVEAEDGLERVRQIVQELRSFSVTGPDRRERVDVCKVLRTSAKIAGGHLNLRARVVMDLHEVPPVLAPEGRLGQVFLNLLINAGQAIPEGAPADNEIRVTTTTLGDQVVVEVRDTGVGIAPEHLPRIFDPFFTTKPGLGTGLGLAICQTIIAGLGGLITVESVVGEGSVFRVRLPIGE